MQKAIENLSIYKQYYSLEEYLFSEVSANFVNNKCLNEAEFFSIIIWKSNRSKTKVLKGVLESKKSIKEITSELFKTKDDKERLGLLTGKNGIGGIGIPIASAILTVCFPNNFTVADYRAVHAIKEILKDRDIKINPEYWTPERYFEYRDLCFEIKEKYNIRTLRETDKILWGYSFYRDLQSLIMGLNNTDNSVVLNS